MTAQYSITFLYYDDLVLAARFYEEVLGFELVLDQGLARIYRVGGGYLGIVDGQRGHLRPVPDSAVLFTIVADDVPEWHRRLAEAQVAGLTAIQLGRFCEHFFFRDPGGYALEVQRFHDPAVAGLFMAGA